MTAGIPVITIDSDAPESKRLFFIGTNNLEAGRLGGRRVAAQLNGKGNVVFFSNPGQPNLDERLKGYKDVFSTYPGIKVVDVFDIKADPGTALDQTTVYLAKTGADKVDAFICLDSRSGANVAEGFKRHNAAGRILIAMDVDADTLRRSDAAAALLGAIGVAATTLRPAGKARFGDEYLDVIAEGDYVNPGSRVQVIEIEGNRIVVKEV